MTKTLRAVELAILKAAISLVDRRGWVPITIPWRSRNRLEELVYEYHTRRAAAKRRSRK